MNEVKIRASSVMNNPQLMNGVMGLMNGLMGGNGSEQGGLANLLCSLGQNRPQNGDTSDNHSEDQEKEKEN